MKEKVIALLSAFGVADTAQDPLLDIIIENTQYKVLNETNTILPMSDGLENVAVSMAAGEYLRFKKGLGQLEGVDLEPAIKQLQEGDTNIQYAIGTGDSTPEQRLDAVISSLLNRSRELYKYRRLVW